MPLEAAHQNRWATGEVVFGIPFLVALGLQFALPLSFPGGLVRLAAILGGAALIITGLAFVVLARRELARRGQPTDPGLPTSHLVTTGVFAVSRNPLYLGAACFVAGVGLAANLPWVLVFLLPSLVACHTILIAPEEKYLAATFGDGYRLYAATVHLWLGRA